MVNHPNRKRNSSARNPTPAEIKKKRLAAGLSQAAAAELIYCSTPTWQQWENEEGKTTHGGNNVHRRMHPAFWELFKIKVKELTE